MWNVACVCPIGVPNRKSLVGFDLHQPLYCANSTGRVQSFTFDFFPLSERYLIFPIEPNRIVQSWINSWLTVLLYQCTYAHCGGFVVSECHASRIRPFVIFGLFYYLFWLASFFFFSFFTENRVIRIKSCKTNWRLIMLYEKLMRKSEMVKKTRHRCCRFCSGNDSGELDFSTKLYGIHAIPTSTINFLPCSEAFWHWLAHQYQPLPFNLSLGKKNDVSQFNVKLFSSIARVWWTRKRVRHSKWCASFQLQHCRHKNETSTISHQWGAISAVKIRILLEINDRFAGVAVCIESKMILPTTNDQIQIQYDVIWLIAAMYVWMNDSIRFKFFDNVNRIVRKRNALLCCHLWVSHFKKLMRLNIIQAQRVLQTHVIYFLFSVAPRKRYCE